MRNANQETSVDTAQETAPTEHGQAVVAGLSSEPTPTCSSPNAPPQIGRKAVVAVIREAISQDAWGARSGQRRSRTARLRLALGRGQVALESGEDPDF